MQLILKKWLIVVLVRVQKLRNRNKLKHKKKYDFYIYCYIPLVFDKQFTEDETAICEFAIINLFRHVNLLNVLSGSEYKRWEIMLN